MSFSPRAITLDLDDTLWPIWPVIERAEAVLDAWLRARCPRTAQRYPVAAMRALRVRVAAENPHLAHDFSAQRMLSLTAALTECEGDAGHAAAAYETFLAARNAVELYPDVADALQRLHARLPLAALTNGNADLARIGLERRFAFSLGAREHGAAKPDASIFLAACDRLGLPPDAVLHVGDDPELDVIGAARAGLRTAWINRSGHAWTWDAPRPDLELSDLAALADWLDTRTPPSPHPPSPH